MSTVATHSVIYCLKNGKFDERPLEVDEITHSLHGETAMNAPKGTIAFRYRTKGEISATKYLINPRIVTCKSLEYFYPLELRHSLLRVMQANNWKMMIRIGSCYAPYQPDKHKLIYTAF